MRKFVWSLVIFLIIAAGYLGYAQFSGGAVPTFGLPIGGEKAKVRERVMAFFENIKFKNDSALKDFVKSGTDPQALYDYLKNSLQIDMNQTEIENIHITQIDLDSNEARARIKVRLKLDRVNASKAGQEDRLMFFYKAQETWLIDIRNF